MIKLKLRLNFFSQFIIQNYKEFLRFALVTPTIDLEKWWWYGSDMWEKLLSLEMLVAFKVAGAEYRHIDKRRLIVTG